MKKSFKTTIVRDGSMCFIPVPFDPKPVFGKARPPVWVTLNGYRYRSTISAMGNGPCVPLRRSHREAAGLEGGETLSVTLELDTEKREVKPPADFVKALKASPPAWERWRELSYTHQREHVEAIEGAKQAETRKRRIERSVQTIATRPAARPAQKRASMSVRGRKSAASSVCRYAAFLRGVSPMNAKMPELKRCFEAAGFGDVKTLLSSGNVVFSSGAASEASLSRAAEEAMQKVLGRTFMTLVRSIDALRDILESDPYAAFPMSPDDKRVVTFLREPRKTKLVLPIELDGARILCVHGSAAFSTYVPGPRGPVFMKLIEKTFGEDVTTRTWDTVKKVAK